MPLLESLHSVIESKFKIWKEAMIKYNSNQDIDMSDEEFDLLEAELLELSKNSYPEIYDFITNTIVKDGEFINIDKTPINNDLGLMVSLFKIKWQSPVNAMSEIKKFIFKCDEQPTEIYIGPKFDGCSLKINKKYIISTRGGLDVTKKLENNKHIKEIIENFDKITTTGLVNGELLVKKSIFKEKYSEEYSHPRSFVSGCLSNETKLSNEHYDDLDFMVFSNGCNPIYKNNNLPYNVWKKIDYRIGSNESYSKIEEYFNYLKSDNFPYACDGIVIAFFVKERKIRNNYPTNMVAVKFPGEIARTKVTGFNWTVKKSGKITPIISVEPTVLDGSTIENCTGYNYQYLVKNRIGIGSIIEITKSGDIIPIVVKTITKSDFITLPDISFKQEGKHLIVENKDQTLLTKFMNGFIHLNIKGFGESLCDKIGKICDYNIIEMFNPELKLKFAEELGFESLTYKKFAQIYDIKTFYLSDLIFILQFDDVGAILSDKIANLLTKTSNDITNIPQKVLYDVCKGEGYNKIKNSMSRLSEFGIKIIKKPIISEDSVTFEMSGEPFEAGFKLTKEEFYRELKIKNPNVIKTTLTKTTNYLIVGSLESNSTKMQKARKYNTKIITYSEALKNGLKI